MLHSREEDKWVWLAAPSLNSCTGLHIKEFKEGGSMTKAPIKDFVRISVHPRGSVLSLVESFLCENNKSEGQKDGA